MGSKASQVMVTAKTCSICKMEFMCGGNTDTCWCFNYPAIMPLDTPSNCHCPDCLAKNIAQHIGDRLSGLNLEEALTEARPFTKQRQLFEHIDYTMEGSHLVFTRWHLLKKGSCCGKECRNCPYPED